MKHAKTQTIRAQFNRLKQIKNTDNIQYKNETNLDADNCSSPLTSADFGWQAYRPSLSSSSTVVVVKKTFHKQQPHLVKSGNNSFDNNE